MRSPVGQAHCGTLQRGFPGSCCSSSRWQWRKNGATDTQTVLHVSQQTSDKLHNSNFREVTLLSLSTTSNNVQNSLLVLDTARVPWIQSIVVVVAKESLDLMMDIIHRFHHRNVLVVHGGSTRHRSIFNGVRALSEGEDGTARIKPKVVIIHDAVRPFVEEDFLLKITMAAKEQGAAGAIRPLVSTVIATTLEGYLDHSLERTMYRASEMPQGFIYDVIYQAYQRCSESDFEFGTECLHLALQYCGTNAKLIEGPPTLWKVTYKRDLAAAESIVKETLSQSACVVTGGSAQATELANALQRSMSALDMEVDVISDLIGDNAKSLSKEWNFIQVSVHSSCFSEVGKTLSALEEADRALLHPVVIIWVYLNVSEDDSSANKPMGGEPAAMMELATRAKLGNILVYGIQLHHSEEATLWGRSVERVAQMSCALIRDRSPALTGQLLQA
uniref:D-ribitol-5-phosphate cytidylyltransferase n=1 Tax=Hucho hucho TaxID=62062 RepID=A0A4W5L306_9TELE